MSSYYAKRFICLIFLSLLPVFSQSVAAQDENREQIFAAGSQTEIPQAGRQSDFQTTRVSGEIVFERQKAAGIIAEESELFERFGDVKIKNTVDDFRRAVLNQHGGFDDSTIGGEKFSFRPRPAIAAAPDDTQDAPVDESFRWLSATKQTLMFLAIQHGYAFTQPKTREAIKGKFWKDYVKSVKSLHGWADGGRFFTNYIAHPMEGAFLGYLQVQNDPQGLKQQFGASPDYWRSRMKAMAWSAAWSTQFEIGPISQASIGNVGLKGKQTYVDIVITPTVGTALLISEDAIDRYVMKRIERSSDNFLLRVFARMLLSPTRTIANVFRFKTPWYRDRPTAR